MGEVWKKGVNGTEVSEKQPCMALKAALTWGSHLEGSGRVPAQHVQSTPSFLWEILYSVHVV